eukprot:GHVS01072625.1.p2 GENE.GHVS01072625.1~~GHVS01072625.1.p2  ORF type:complete len:146 (-),score=25.36 GHVS01072625.1:1382-1819(-)
MTAHRPASPSSSPSSATWCPPCRRLKPSPELGWTLLEGNQWQPAPPPSSAFLWSQKCCRLRCVCCYFALVTVAAVFLYCPPLVVAPLPNVVEDRWVSLRDAKDQIQYPSDKLKQQAEYIWSFFTFELLVRSSWRSRGATAFAAAL